MKSVKVLSNLAYIAKKTWEYSKSCILLRALSAAATGITPAVIAYLLKLLVDRIFVKDVKHSLQLIVVILFYELTISFLNKYITKKTALVYDLFRNELKFDLFKKSVEIDYEILASPETTTKRELALIAINRNFASKYLDCIFALASAMISIISLLYVLSIVSWWVIAVAGVIVVLRIGTILIQKKVAYHTQVDMAPVNKKISYYMQVMGDPSYADEMRMHPIASWLIDKYRQTIREIRGIYIKLNEFNFKSNLFLRTLSLLEQTSYYIFLLFQVVFSGLSYADFSMLLSAMKSLSGQVTSVFKTIIEVFDNSLYVDAYREFMELENRIAIDGVGINASMLTTGAHIYSLKNISFRYPGSNQYVFKNLYIELEANKFYVVVGRNGAGKTTFCKLLCRLFDPDEGVVEFNGVDIKDIEHRSYKRMIGIAFQNYKYYEMTVAENIAMDKYVQDDLAIRKKVIDCIATVELKDKIMSMPKGIETMLGRLFDDEGTLLSGGEVQKLALARVLFMESPVIILDEPSSAIDAISESSLMKTIISATHQKTVFYVSHRLSIAKYADKVIFIDGGRIAGFDSHEQLLATNSSYAEMYNSQSQHYT